jgi:hypothetical protein
MTESTYYTLPDTRPATPLSSGAPCRPMMTTRSPSLSCIGSASASMGVGAAAAPAPDASPTAGQGLTLVHSSAQLERFLWDKGC